jgi:hypothetical protein
VTRDCHAIEDGNIIAWPADVHVVVAIPTRSYWKGVCCASSTSDRFEDHRRILDGRSGEVMQTALVVKDILDYNIESLETDTF